MDIDIDISDPAFSLSIPELINNSDEIVSITNNNLLNDNILSNNNALLIFIGIGILALIIGAFIYYKKINNSESNKVNLEVDNNSLGNNNV